METDPDLLQFLAAPLSYPEATSRVSHVETHISHVFLCDRFVYKVKKPVNLHFLDFSTLRRRGFYCRQEVHLNSRLAQGVYLGAVPICRTPNGFSFNNRSNCRVAEYAVKMRRLPQEAMLSRLIDEGRHLYGELESVARLLTAFHGGATIHRDGRRGGTASIRRKTEENFSQMEPFCGTTVDPALFGELRDYTRQYIADHSARILGRARSGFVRDGHGDLHAEHVCLIRPPVIFDCIEFNRDFRIIDVIEDIAFLLMDLEFKGRFDLSSRLHRDYFGAGCDAHDEGLLSFYKTYRAVVRGKVQSFLSSEGQDETIRCEAARHARDYFTLLSYYLHQQGTPFNPLVFMGLSGSGKSTVAREFRGDRIILRSDEIRKEIFKTARAGHEYVEYGKGTYTEDKTAVVYEALADKTIDLARQGEKVIADATYLQASQRIDLYRRCMGQGLNPFFIHCVADPGVLKDRVMSRMAGGSDPSDAHLGVLECQIRDQQEPSELPRFRVLRLNTEGTLHDLVMALREFV